MILFDLGLSVSDDALLSFDPPVTRLKLLWLLHTQWYTGCDGVPPLHAGLARTPD